jgi:cellulose synthase/poly-beta-1,6-N-acetylglucosamine synthase-like glycosyltransferase
MRHPSRPEKPRSNGPWSGDPLDPSVTVVVPCRNERAFIESCLESLLEQRGQPLRYEIVVVDGMSDDGTREILSRVASQEPRVRVLDNPQRIASTALNIAIRNSTSDVIIRVDGHVRVALDFVRASLRLLAEHPEAWTVGGPVVHRGRTTFARGVAVAMASWFGVGGARHRSEDYEGYAEGAVFPAIRRRVFTWVGLFDETLVRNQDDEFNLRITEAGGSIYISPRVKHEYYVRERVDALFRQYLQYGYWKVQVMRKHRKVVAPRHLVPVAFAVMVPISLVGSVLAPALIKPLLLVPLAAYTALALTFFGGTMARTRHVGIAAAATLAAATMHAAYGLGTLLGLVAPPATAAGSLRAAMERISR